jgi:hypothetical protein
MSLADLIAVLGDYSLYIGGYFLLFPVMVFLYTAMLKKSNAYRKPHKYVLSTIIYLSCIPGMFSATLTVYTLFILRENLLAVNSVIYFLPIISMIAVLMILRSRKINPDLLPGFGRIKGLMLILAGTFAITFLLLQMRIWVIFGGSLWWLLGGMALIFILIKHGAKAFWGK